MNTIRTFPFLFSPRQQPKDHWFTQLQWQSASWTGWNGQEIAYQYVQINDHIPSVLGDGYMVNLCKWSKSYSIAVLSDNEPILVIKQIPMALLEDDPDRIIRAVDEQILNAVPHRASNIGALERYLDRLADEVLNDPYQFGDR